jgi:hypothetical protein
MHVQGGHVLAEERRLPVGDRPPVLAALHRALQQRIVGAGHVLHVVHFMARVDPRPLQDVERHVGRGMAHVGGVVGGDPGKTYIRATGPGAVGRTSPVGSIEEPQGQTPGRAGVGTGGRGQDLHGATLIREGGQRP